MRASVKAALIHLSISVLLAGLSALLVFGLWYPYPYSELSGGKALLIILLSVDVTCGPLLTLIVFDPKKSKAHLWRDLSVIAAVQLSALCYGLYSLAQARPLFMAFEGDRFRVVTAIDVNPKDWADAPAGFEGPGWGRPRLIGAKLAQPTDRDFVKSVTQSLQGTPPAYRPARWTSFEVQRQRVVQRALAIRILKQKNPKDIGRIDDAVRETGLSETQLGYIPLVSDRKTDWVVIVDRGAGQPRAYLPLDGW